MSTLSTDSSNFMKTKSIIAFGNFLLRDKRRLFVGRKNHSFILSAVLVTHKPKGYTQKFKYQTITTRINFVLDFNFVS